MGFDKRKVIVVALVVLLLEAGASFTGGLAHTYDRGYGICSYSVTRITDNGYIVAAQTESCGAGMVGIYLCDTNSLGHTAITELALQEAVAFSFSVSPNPFNSSCVIAAPAGAEIEIYDLLGNPVWSKTIPRSAQANLVWQPDETVASGIYLVKAFCEGECATRKLVYLK